MKFAFRSVLLLIFMASLISVTLAQVGNSSISGFVYDQTQTVVPSASVVLTQPATGFHRDASSDESGYFKFPALQPGTYELRVSKAGFQTHLATGIVLLVAQDLPHTVTLQVGATTQEITVQALAQMLESESAVVGQ